MIALAGLLLQCLLPFICKTTSYNDGGNFITQKLILLTSIELIHSSHLAREEPYFTEFNTNFFQAGPVMDLLEQPSMAGHGVEIAVDFQVMLENGV